LRRRRKVISRRQFFLKKSANCISLATARGPNLRPFDLTRTIVPSMTASLACSPEAGAIPIIGFGTSPLTGGLTAETVLTALKVGYRAQIRHRGRGRRGDARLGDSARRDFPHHQG
jgi:hypothetical protein